MSPLLEVSDLRVRFGDVAAVRGVSFSLNRGDAVAIVGESGSGKSTVAKCLSGLIQPPESSGSVRLDGTEVVGASEDDLRPLRWAKVALALQGSPFNPVVSIGDQIIEPMVVHRGMAKGEARRRADELCREVLLDPILLESFPHQLSGGERRRATLAMVLALDPDLVVLDEPTAGLDPDTKADVVARINALRERRGFAMVVISHDLPDAAKLAERTLVFYAGETMESGPTHSVIGTPAHPYSWALVNAYPVMTTAKDLRPVRGLSPDPRAVPPGCPFNPRCTQAEDVCVTEHPPLLAVGGRHVACHFGGLKNLLEGVDLHKTFRSRRREVPALRGVSLRLREGESLGIVGPSGSGKTTLARILAGYLAPDAGHVILEGTKLPGVWHRNDRVLRRRIQLVMQDPNDALSPRLTVEEMVREPLDVGRDGDGASRLAAVAEALMSVGLPSAGTFLKARAHELSGGQLQRVALARALVLHPKLLVADEPTAMLDASEQARLLVVLRERQIEMGLGLIIVSHDVAVVRKVTDRILVLDQGLVVEEGLTHLVLANPFSDTTRRLLASAPAFAADG